MVQSWQCICQEAARPCSCQRQKLEGRLQEHKGKVGQEISQHCNKLHLVGLGYKEQLLLCKVSFEQALRRKCLHKHGLSPAPPIPSSPPQISELAEFYHQKPSCFNLISSQNLLFFLFFVFNFLKRMGSESLNLYLHVYAANGAHASVHTIPNPRLHWSCHLYVIPAADLIYSKSCSTFCVVMK